MTNNRPAETPQSLWGGFGLGAGINVSEGDAWRSRGATDLLRGNLLAIIVLYPSSRGGFFLKSGVGFGYMQTECCTSGGLSQKKGGFGATAGAGFDIRLGRNFYLVPAVDWHLQAIGADSSAASQAFSDTNGTVSFSVGLVWH